MELVHEPAFRESDRQQAASHEDLDGEWRAAEQGDPGDGQIVTIIARWVLICAGFVIALWSPSERDLGALKIALLILFGLAISNFAMHTNVIMRRPMATSLVYAFSAIDIAAVTAMIWLFGGGVDNPLFVFYYPALLALSLVFLPAITGVFTAGIVLLYAAAGLSSHPAEGDQQVFAARVISLIAVAVVCALSQHIEEDRRRAHGATAEARTGTYPPI